MEVYLDGVAIPKLDKDYYGANIQESAGIKEQILKRHFQQIENILQQHFNVFPEDIGKCRAQTAEYATDGTLSQTFTVGDKAILKVVYPKFDPFNEMKISYFLYPQTGEYNE